MSSARRRINSTGRKRIRRECVEVRMLKSLPDEPLRAKVSLNLDGSKFPDEARVAIEAYHRSSSMRFDFGRVGALQNHKELVLSEIENSAVVLFRLVVIDEKWEPGKLLGSAERLKPRDEEDSEDRRSIFPVRYRDLKNEVWRVEIVPDAHPVLMINSRLPGFKFKVRNDPVIQGLLIPAALRFVLQELVGSGETNEDEDEPGWKEEWFDYCRNELGFHSDPRKLDEAAAKDWIEDVMSVFCKDHSFCARIKASLEGVQ